MKSGTETPKSMQFSHKLNLIFKLIYTEQVQIWQPYECYCLSYTIPGKIMP